MLEKGTLLPAEFDGYFSTMLIEEARKRAIIFQFCQLSSIFVRKPLASRQNGSSYLAEKGLESVLFVK